MRPVFRMVREASHPHTSAGGAARWAPYQFPAPRYRFVNGIAQIHTHPGARAPSQCAYHVDGFGAAIHNAFLWVDTAPPQFRHQNISGASPLAPPVAGLISAVATVLYAEAKMNGDAVTCSQQTGYVPLVLQK